MATTTATASRPTAYAEREAGASEAPTSGVTWAPIIGGAFAAASLSLILMALGSGLGLASVSPWPNSGASATTFSIMTAIWLVIVHWLASGFGGYLTGRLRTKVVGLHTHEVFFRDSAHGLLSWATATVLALALFGSAAATVIAGGAKATGSIAAGAVQGAGQVASAATSNANIGDPSAYFVDMLFRSDRPASNSGDQDVRSEATRILLSGLQRGDVPPPDRAYLAQLIASRTGISQPDAEKRVSDVIDQAKAAETKARETADAARKAGAYLALFTALAMVVGAFVASVAGALGGSHRDEWSNQLAMRR
jgi:hypothetical protein